MKPGPVVAMVLLILVGFWLVLQPSIARTRRIDETAHRFTMELGAADVAVEQREIRSDDPTLGYEYHFIGRSDLESMGWLTSEDFQATIRERLSDWESRPSFDRHLLGFFNITGWRNFVWVAVGLVGQIAFFGRMLIQWIASEKSGESVVPVLFWWFSFLGGICLFTYFVWRVDIVGVLGQSTGVVIYARNLRLIQKQKRRARDAATGTIDPEDKEPAHAGVS